MLHVPANVRRELFRGRVAALRLFAQSPQDDIVQVSSEPFTQFLWRALAQRTHQARMAQTATERSRRPQVPSSVLTPSRSVDERSKRPVGRKLSFEQ
jgi:hypothetical protein